MTREIIKPFTIVTETEEKVMINDKIKEENNDIKSDTIAKFSLNFNSLKIDISFSRKRDERRSKRY